MVDLLLEMSKYRDYRLKINWGCKVCGCKDVHIVIDRTKAEFLAGKRNIKQGCIECNELSIPFKQCTGCARVYPLDFFTCEDCEVEIRRITELKLQSEEALKNKDVHAYFGYLDAASRIADERRKKSL